MANRDKDNLIHIRDYCRDINSFIERFGKNFETFTTDRAYFNSVSMCLLQIGELSGTLSEEFRSKTSNYIPWPEIRGMRNIVAHQYGSIDEELVWETAINDIPVLLDFCTNQLNQT